MPLLHIAQTLLPAAYDSGGVILQPTFSLLILVLVGVASLSLGGAVCLLVRWLISSKGQPGSKKMAGFLQAERSRQQAIYHLISVLSSTLNYQRVLDSALDLSGSILIPDKPNSPGMVSAVMLFMENQGPAARLGVACSRRLTPSDQRLLFPGKQGLLAEVIESSESAGIASAAADPELTRMVALHPCRSVHCLPLRAGLETFGVLLYGHPAPDFFTAERRESLEVIAKQAVIAIQNARLYENLEKEKEKMLEIQEEARRKLARDLHDGPTQSVAAIAMRVNFARRLIEKDPAATVDELVKIEEVARRTTKEIRHMLFTLRPLVLESQGLVPALQAMAEKMHETYEQNVVVQADSDSLPELDMSKQTVIFYIVEEAVTNARKHSQASRIIVSLKTIENDLALVEIEDDGVGFNVGAIDAFYDRRGSLGMINMRERVELVNGVFGINSEEGRGTLIQVLIPLTEQAADRMRNGQ
jgi:signal transduction histidine kinase